MSDTDDQDESGGETATERALIARRPRSGREYDDALAAVREQFDELRGAMSESDFARSVEIVLDISWLAYQGHITADEMTARIKRAADRQIARMGLRRKGGL